MAKDFAFVIKLIVDGVKTHFDFEYKPDTLLADSAASITNGFTIGFGYKPFWRIICRAHALRKFDTVYSKPLSINNKILALEDLLFLQASDSIEVFTAGRKLLVEKWKKNKSLASCFDLFFIT